MGLADEVIDSSLRGGKSNSTATWAVASDLKGEALAAASPRVQML